MPGTVYRYEKPRSFTFGFTDPRIKTTSDSSFHGLPSIDDLHSTSLHARFAAGSVRRKSIDRIGIIGANDKELTEVDFRTLPLNLIGRENELILAIKTNTFLKKIDLVGSCITENGLMRLIKALSLNKTIMELRISEGEFDTLQQQQKEEMQALLIERFAPPVIEEKKVLSRGDHLRLVEESAVPLARFAPKRQSSIRRIVKGLFSLPDDKTDRPSSGTVLAQAPAAAPQQRVPSSHVPAAAPQQRVPSHVSAAAPQQRVPSSHVSVDDPRKNLARLPPLQSGTERRPWNFFSRGSSLPVVSTVPRDDRKEGEQPVQSLTFSSPLFK